MPIFDFECECGELYEELVAGLAEEYPSVICPKCGSDKKIKLMSACSVSFVQPEGTRRWIGSGGHDYRFHHNLPKVIEERKQAELASHMGQTPYRNIDDIHHGKHFGEVR